MLQKMYVNLRTVHQMACKNNMDKDHTNDQQEKTIAAAFANCFGQCVLIINLRTRGISFAANLRKLSGDTPADVESQGFDFFTQSTDKEGFDTLHDVERYWPLFFEGQEAEQQDFSISCFIKMNVEGQVHNVMATFSPYAFAPDGTIETAICVMELDHTGGSDIILHNNKTGQKYYFCRERKRWIAQQSIELSEQERQIIKHFSNGCKVSEIAEKMSISAHTVNYHKRKLFEKLGVNSMSKAVALVGKEVLDVS